VIREVFSNVSFKARMPGGDSTPIAILSEVWVLMCWGWDGKVVSTSFRGREAAGLGLFDDE